MLRRGLYLVTPDGLETSVLVAALAAVLPSRPALVQYRNKLADASLRREQALRLLEICRAADVPLIINDNLPLALEIDADGVHLGRDDGDPAAARKVLGPERAMKSYPFRTWFDLGLKPATGSDAPVCNPNPFPNFHTMLTRQTWKGTVMDAAQRVSIEEALQAYTEFGAFSQKQENVKGRLAPGFLADVGVLVERERRGFRFVQHFELVAEHFDGAGYPNGLKGRDIPVAARIVAVVDVFDALLHERPYKEPWPYPQVREYIEQRSGSQFDPEVVTALLDLIDHEPQLWHPERATT